MRIIVIMLVLSVPFTSYAAIQFIGQSTSVIYTDGAAPGAITPHASTTTGDLVIFYHYSNVDTGTETVTPPSGFTTVFNAISTSYGLICVAYRVRQAGDTTYQATIANHTSGTTGDTVIEWLETYRGQATSSPILYYTAANSTWVTSTNIGPISAPGTATVNDGEMVVVFGGRRDNVTGQTVLTGNSLTWATRALTNTNSGRDAGAVTQNGLNSSGSDQTITAKTITTTGTSQAGAGRMFTIESYSPQTYNMDTALLARSTLDDNGARYTTSYGVLDSKSAITDTNLLSANGYLQLSSEGSMAELNLNSTFGVLDLPLKASIADTGKLDMNNAASFNVQDSFATSSFVPAGAFIGMAHYVTPTKTVNQFVKLKIVSIGSTGKVGAIVRSETASGYRYSIVYDAETAQLQWQRWNWNTYMDVIASVPATFANGDTLGVTIQGTGVHTRINVWKNPVQEIPFDMDNWDSQNDVSDYSLVDSSNKLFENAADTGKYVGITITKLDVSPVLDDFCGGDANLFAIIVELLLSSKATAVNTNTMVMQEIMSFISNAAVSDLGVRNLQSAVDLIAKAQEQGLSRVDIATQLALNLTARLLETNTINYQTALLLNSAISQSQIAKVDWKTLLSLAMAVSYLSDATIVSPGGDVWNVEIAFGVKAIMSLISQEDIQTALILSTKVGVQPSNISTINCAVVLSAYASHLPISRIQWSAILSLSSEIAQGQFSGLSYITYLIFGTEVSISSSMSLVISEGIVELIAKGDIDTAAKLGVYGGLLLNAISSTNIPSIQVTDVEVILRAIISAVHGEILPLEEIIYGLEAAPRLFESNVEQRKIKPEVKERKFETIVRPK